MRYHKKRIFGVSLAVLMTAATAWGCSAPNAAQPTITAPATVTVPQNATIPLDKDDPMLPVTKPVEGNSENVVQLRLYDVRSGWMNAFNTEQGAFLLADSVDSLLDGLSDRGINTSKLDLSGFDAAFFENNRLVVIPRRTNSGSVRFGARIDRTDGGVVITPVGQMPGVGTADMADWLVLVSLNRADYPGSVTVEQLREVADNTQRYAAHRY
jgi:hypothetical protein